MCGCEVVCVSVSECVCVCDDLVRGEEEDMIGKHGSLLRKELLSK